MPKEFMGMVPKAPSQEEVNSTKILNLEHELASVLSRNSHMKDYIAGHHGDTLILGSYSDSLEKISEDLEKIYQDLAKDSRFKDLRVTANGISATLVEPIGSVSKISLSLNKEQI